MSVPRWALSRRRAVAWVGGGAVLLLLALWLALALGYERVDAWGGLWSTGPMRDQSIIWGARLPRVLMAAAVGGLLGLGGALFQAVLRNPLADPYVLGTAGGAALGTMLAIGTGIALSVPLGRLACSLLGAFVALACVLAVAKRPGRVPAHTLILVGVVVNSFCGSAILLTVSLLDTGPAHSAVLWMMGSLGIPSLWDAGLAGGALLLALALAWPMARTANLMAGGEEAATFLGVDVPRARWWLLAVGGLCTGAAVGQAGPIGFVGLVVPHCVRRVAGADHRLLLPLSVLAGAALLVLADIPARSLLPSAIPVGVFTAMLGVPFFLFLLRRTDSGLWARTA